MSMVAVQPDKTPPNTLGVSVPARSASDQPQGGGGRVERSGNTADADAAGGRSARACHIRHNLPQALDPLAGAIEFGTKFPTKTMVNSAASLLHPVPHWDGSENTAKRFYLRVAPGSVQLLRRDEAAFNRSSLLAQANQIKVTDTGLTAARLALETYESIRDQDVKIVGHDYVEVPDEALQEGWEFINPSSGKRDVITQWSQKSRVNMIRTLSQLDYSPLFAGGGIPAMVTLTLPSDWLTVAPTSKDYQGMVLKFRKRWEREWGTMNAIWKREFQRRGAPHTHFFVTVPLSNTSDGRSFKTWLSETWAAVVNHPDPHEYSKHVLAGTGVDFSEGMKAADPQRLAVYFSKHGSANSGGVKEYQNEAPEQWEGQSAGRFWGVWHLQKATATVALSYDEWITASRIMRRHHDAKGLVRKYKEWAIKTVDQRTGEVEYELHDKQARSVRKFIQGSGFITANDGAAFAAKIARFLDLRSGRLPAGQSIDAVLPHWPATFKPARKCDQDHVRD